MPAAMAFMLNTSRPLTSGSISDSREPSFETQGTVQLRKALRGGRLPTPLRRSKSIEALVVVLTHDARI